jgi:hypothetical protein
MGRIAIVGCGGSGKSHLVISEWDKDPRPFIWTKAAGEILETLAAYCSRISEPGH